MSAISGAMDREGWPVVAVMVHPEQGTRAAGEFIHFNKLQNSEMQNHFFSLENLVRILIPSVFAILFDEIAEIKNIFIIYCFSQES